MSLRAIVSAIVIHVMIVVGFTVTPGLAQDAPVLAEIDRTMENYRLDAHIPGMVWGIVLDGRLVHVKGAGVQDIVSKRPVTADTLFRIASMTKAFTALSILQLRDEGTLALDAPVETYVPELRSWKYPTDDSPKIRVRELLTHTAGFVTDDPWGIGRRRCPRTISRGSCATAWHSRGRRRRRWSIRIWATRCSAASSPTSPGSPTRTSSTACSLRHSA
jgi:CubicO group peptidase (beta-lactamase class C family)